MKIQTTQNSDQLTTVLKLGALVLPLLLTLVFAVSSWAYGPERKEFTIKEPAGYITFNSIRDNPNYGNEKNFVLVKDASNTSAGGWTDKVKVQDGKEYLVRMYVHNNAAENLNLVAKNTRLSVNVPNTYSTTHQIDGFLSANKPATPEKIWDSVVLEGDKQFIATFVGNSARYYNNVNPNPGFQLSNDIVTSKGALVGYQKMDGNVPGCFEYSGVATFKIKVTTRKDADFELTKKVRHTGTGEWKDRVDAKVGDRLEYRIGYDNSGSTVQNNVIVRDTPPKGIAYTKGSSTLKNATNPNGNGKSVGNDSLITGTGVNIGNYTPKSNAFIYYSAVVTKDDLKCGENKLENKASASTDNGRKSDTAEVVVKVECQPNECKPGVPVGDERCDKCIPKDGEKIDENGNCVPAALPTTGPAQIIAGIMGVTLVSLGVAYWIRSRHEYKKALAGFTEDFTEEPEEPLLEARNSHSNNNDAQNFHKK